MSSECRICNRKTWGAGVPRTKKAAEFPIKIYLEEERSIMSEVYKLIPLGKVCIDCRPKFEKALKKWIKEYKEKE